MDLTVMTMDVNQTGRASVAFFVAFSSQNGQDEMSRLGRTFPAVSSAVRMIEVPLQECPSHVDRRRGGRFRSIILGERMANGSSTPSNISTDTPDADARVSVPRTDACSAYSRKLALSAAQTADNHRGSNIVVLDVRKLTSMFDYFVLVTGTSRRQLHAISEEIDEYLERELGDERMGIEGYAESRWILLDYGSVVVHLFDRETRDYFALEDLWADAEKVDWAA